MKAQPALFEGKRRGEPKNEALLFQSTIDIHFQNAHKTFLQSTVEIHFQNTKKLRRLALCAFMYRLQVLVKKDSIFRGQKITEGQKSHPNTH